MFACYLSDVQTACEILLPLLLLKTHYEPSSFVLIVFLLLKEGKAHMQLSHAPHNYPC